MVTENMHAINKFKNSCSALPITMATSFSKKIETEAKKAQIKF